MSLIGRIVNLTSHSVRTRKRAQWTRSVFRLLHDRYVRVCEVAGVYAATSAQTVISTPSERAIPRPCSHHRNAIKFMHTHTHRRIQISRPAWRPCRCTPMQAERDNHEKAASDLFVPTPPNRTIDASSIPKQPRRSPAESPTFPHLPRQVKVRDPTCRATAMHASPQIRSCGCGVCGHL